MRNHLIKAIVGLLALVAFPLVGVTGTARASSPCPDIHYLGDYPGETDLSWSENVQGIAHNDDYWFVTNIDHLHRIPLTADLAESPSWNSTNRVGLPSGYNHFGDVDFYGGFLFVPLQSDHKSAIAAYRPDLTLVDVADVAPVQGNQNGWLAVNPVNGDLYSSGNWLADGEGLFRYHLNIAGLQAGGSLEDNLYYVEQLYVTDQDGSPLPQRPHDAWTGPFGAFGSMQGGAFTPSGELFISNGYYDKPASWYRGGIHLFGTDLRLITESTNGSGDFNFEYHPDDPSYDEPEGIDWFPKAQNSGTPGIAGDLHALLLDNDVTNGDDLLLKHYSVDWFCNDGVAPTVIGTPDRPANADGWYDAPVTIDWQVFEASGFATEPGDTIASTEGASVPYVSDRSCDRAGNCGVGRLSLSIDLTNPVVACRAATFALNQPNATVSADVSDAVSGPVDAVVSTPIDTSVVGTRTVALTGADHAGRQSTATCAYSVAYNFDGFLSPVVNSPAVNRTAAGRVVPVRWRVTDFNGAPIDSASVVSITSAPCATTDASNADGSLRYFGDGTAQFNWQTQRTYAGQCRTLRLNLADGSSHTATFQFQ